MIYTPLMETPEYKELYQNGKAAFPDMDEYFLQVACLSYLQEQGIKYTSNIEVINEVQKELPA